MCPAEKKGIARCGENPAQIPEEKTLASQTVFVASVLTLGRPALATRIVLLAGSCPGTAALSTLASTGPAALRLHRATHFVAIESTGIHEGESTPRFDHHVERDLIALNAAGKRRRTTRPVETAAEPGTVLLNLQGGLHVSAAALPGHLPTPGNVGGLAGALWCILRPNPGCCAENQY